MASESKKTKSETTPKKDAPAKVESAGAEAAPKRRRCTQTRGRRDYRYGTCHL